MKLDELEEAVPCCEDCGDELEWERCGECEGDGWVEGYEFDGAPVDDEPCGLCEGRGGWQVCWQADKHHEDQKRREETRP